MDKTRVVNIKKQPYEVYIGRAGKGEDGYFGSPIRLYSDCPICGILHRDNGSTLCCYTLYFKGRIKRDPEFKKRVQELKGKILGCFCKPWPCHGDVIVEYLENE